MKTQFTANRYNNIKSRLSLIYTLYQLIILCIIQWLKWLNMCYITCWDSYLHMHILHIQ